MKKGSNKKREIKVLISGAGAPGIAGTIYSLRNNQDNKLFRIVAVDINEDVVGKYLSDKYYKVPPPENKNYIKEIIKIVKKEKINVVIPQTTREINILSLHRDSFHKLDVSILVSKYEDIITANDKFLLLEKAKEIGIPYPLYILANSKKKLIDAITSFGYPQKKVVIKPRVSNGMRGVRVICDKSWDVKRFLGEKPDGLELGLDSLLEILEKGSWPELLVMEYLPGMEYTVDVFQGQNNVLAIPRRREKIRSGITFDASIDLRNDLIDYSCKLAKCLNLKYCFGFQFKLSDRGVPKIIECNPRVQGTMVAGVFAGFNMIYASVLDGLGEKLNLKNIKLKNNSKFKRFWGGVAIEKGKITGRL